MIIISLLLSSAQREKAWDEFKPKISFDLMRKLTAVYSASRYAAFFRSILTLVFFLRRNEWKKIAKRFTEFLRRWKFRQSIFTKKLENWPSSFELLINTDFFHSFHLETPKLCAHYLLILFLSTWKFSFLLYLEFDFQSRTVVYTLIINFVAHLKIFKWKNISISVEMTQIDVGSMKYF